MDMRRLGSKAALRSVEKALIVQKHALLSEIGVQMSTKDQRADVRVICKEMANVLESQNGDPKEINRLRNFECSAATLRSMKRSSESAGLTPPVVVTKPSVTSRKRLEATDPFRNQEMFKRHHTFTMRLFCAGKIPHPF